MKHIKQFENSAGLNPKGDKRIFVINKRMEGPDCFHPNSLPKKLNAVYKKMKFHVDDHVWYERDHRIIEIVELFCENEYIYYLEENKNMSGRWVSEKELKLIPDYEIDSIKYNL